MHHWIGSQEEYERIAMLQRINMENCKPMCARPYSGDLSVPSHIIDGEFVVIDDEVKPTHRTSVPIVGHRSR